MSLDSAVEHLLCVCTDAATPVHLGHWVTEDFKDDLNVERVQSVDGKV